MEFDAIIDLTTDHVPAHVLQSAAAEQVRAAVEHLPGANWISVKWYAPRAGRGTAIATNRSGRVL